MEHLPSYIQRQIVDRYSDRGRYFRGAYKEEGLAAIAEGKKHFPFYTNVFYQYMEPRPLLRYLFINKAFPQYLEGKLLDVGSRDNTLRDVLKKDAVLIDKNNPNLASFDWEKEPLPFGDNSFDTVVCLDTLEHIDNLHGAFEDLLRVSKRYIIISLPNCWRKAFRQMILGKGVQASYGLPPEKPMDRHRWFFNSEDIETFFFYQSAANTIPFSVRRIAYHAPITLWRHHIIYGFFRYFLPARYFKNLMVNTVFVVLEKLPHGESK